MGYLLYGERATDVEIDDRALAHLKIVILAKLRRHESFAFSWPEPASRGSGRNTIWLHPMITLRFRFLGSRRPVINAEWIRKLTDLANTPEGLVCAPEPQDAALTRG
jgi:hypothetical protein